MLEAAAGTEPPGLPDRRDTDERGHRAVSVTPSAPTRSVPVEVRRMRPADFGRVRALCAMVYPSTPTWSEEQLGSHLRVFPEGQFVAVHRESGDLIGMASSLILLWEDYGLGATWRDFTDGGMFTNHDPRHGRTLYGAEVMVHPAWQGHGVGKQLYVARRALARELGLLRIRAGARLRDYHRHAAQLTPEQYVAAVVRGELGDRTLSFQLGQGFFVIGVVAGYLANDPESLGYAAVIEWVNDQVAAVVGYTPPAWPDPA
jgi:GNAT superfamily N-acetyltransferase